MTFEDARPVRTRVVRGVVLVVVLLAVAAAWVAWRGVQVVSAMQRAVPAVSAVQVALRDGQVGAVAEQLPALRDAAAKARAATSDPLWRAAGGLPWLGVQLRAVDAMVLSFDQVATEVLVPLAEVGSSVDAGALAPVGGRVQLAPVEAAAPIIVGAADALEEAHARLAGVDPERLVGPLARRVEDATAVLGEAAGTLRAVGTAAELVPPMLGRDGERQYLVLLLNPAELRSGGGIVGAVALLSAVDGVVTLVEHVAAHDLPQYDAALLPLSTEEVAVHGRQLGRVMQNATMTPDFPRAAELAVAIWEAGTGTYVDGVVSADPIALARALEATGPVVEPSGTRLDAGNVVPELLSNAYATHLEPVETDRYFAGAASAVFEALAAGQGNPARLVRALVDAAGDGRVSVWSRHGQEQDRLAGTGPSGGFFASAAAGVFLDDTTGSKLDYYLDSDVELVCTGTDGQVRLHLASRVPDPATLSPYVLGPDSGLPPGSTRTNITVYAPPGGQVVAVTRAGAAVGGRQATEAGREVLVLTSTLAPGDDETYVIDMTVPAGERLELWTTPGVQGSARVSAECP